MVGSFFLALLSLTVPFYMMNLFQKVIPSSSMETLLGLSIFAMGALVALHILERMRARLLARAATRLQSQFASKLLEYDLLADKPFEYEGTPMTQHLAALQKFLTGKLSGFCIDVIMSPIFIVALFFIHPMIALIAVLGGGVLLFYTFSSSRALKKYQLGRRAQVRAVNAIEGSLRKNQELVRSHGLIADGVRSWGSRAAPAYKKEEELGNEQSSRASMARFGRMALQVLLMGTGATLVVQGKMQAVGIFASSLIAGRALSPVDTLVGSWDQVQAALTAYQAFFGNSKKNAFVNNLPKLPPSVDVPVRGSSIEVRGLTFVGHKEQKILDNVSFKIPDGSSLAIIGWNGAGKSTLAKLIAGALLPHSGAVHVGGVPVHELPNAKREKIIGYLPQNPVPFAGTVSENAARLKKNARLNKNWDVGELCELESIAKRLPDGFETMLGDGGIQLSGGQAQRLMLAHALCTSPKILILDEPTSALDPEQTKRVADLIKLHRSRGNSVIVVTHSMELAKTMDLVMVMEMGKMQRMGTPAEILGASKSKSGAAGQAAVNRRRAATSASAPDLQETRLETRRRAAGG